MNNRLSILAAAILALALCITSCNGHSIADDTEKGIDMKEKFVPLSECPRAVILDTDIGPDCDDAGAVAVLIHYAKQYNFPIIGAANCTSNPAGNATLKTLFEFCDYPTPPMAKWDGEGFFDQPQYCTYNTTIAERFQPDYMKNEANNIEAPVSFYRRLLAGAEDNSVMLITIGMFNNIAALLNSSADEYSELDGKSLVQKKVYAVVSMGCKYPEGREFNIYCAKDAAQTVLTEIGVPLYLSDFHIGASAQTNIKDLEERYAAEGRSAEENPIYLAYRLFTGSFSEGHCIRPTFDLTAVQFAVLGEGEYYGLETGPGRIEFYDGGSGLCDYTRYVPDQNGFVWHMKKTAPDTVIAAELERILKSFN